METFKDVRIGAVVVIPILLVAGLVLAGPKPVMEVLGPVLGIIVIVGVLSAAVGAFIRGFLESKSNRLSAIDEDEQAMDKQVSLWDEIDEEDEPPDPKSPEAQDATRKIRKAYELLRDFNIAEIVPELMDWRWLYKSTDGIDFETNLEAPKLRELRDAALIRYQGHEIIIAAGEFDHLLPQFDPETEREVPAQGDAYVLFDEEEVLRLTAFRTYDSVEQTKLNLGWHWIKYFKAGPWLEMLNDCYPKLKAVKEQGLQEHENKTVIDKAEKFDLGEYE